MNTIEIMLAIATPVGAAIGSFIGMRVTVSRLREDVQALFAKVDGLRADQHRAQLEHEREHGEVKAALATLEANVEAIQSPWKRKSQHP